MPSRSILSTGASPVKVPVSVVDNPLLPSKTPELSDAEASDSSDSGTSADDFEGESKGESKQWCCYVLSAPDLS